MTKNDNRQLEMPWAQATEPPVQPVREIHEGLIASVALDAPLDKAYSFIVPPELKGILKPGMLVEVPVGRDNRHYKAYVLKISNETWSSALKPIARILDERTLLSPKLMELACWVSDYYLSPIGLTIASFIPSTVVKSAGKTTRAKPFIRQEPRKEPAFDLNEDQRRVMDRIEKAVDAGRFAVMLVHGVTASGKTELYIRAIRRVLDRGQGAIYLVPEIALTAQMIHRLAERFDQVAVLHSGLTDAQRRATWQAVSDGLVRVVIGTRSAVFAPVPELGLIVVDEEQEPSYKNMQSPRFNTRDLAIKRAQVEGVTILLGSATPALESYHNSQTNPAWIYLSLPNRIANLPLPPVSLVDMAEEKTDRPGVHTVSRLMEEKIQETIAAGKQVMLLLNRRGFAGYVFCPSCKYILVCPSCGTRMVYHKATNRVQCHHCSVKMAVPEKCDRCGHQMNKFGLGTQRVEEELVRKFPTLRIARMDMDTMSRVVDYEETLNGFAAGKTDVLIGTQMIAKGLDFPNVQLVGIISADMALSLPDFRAGERTFQLLAQVAGRAGRADYAGLVVVQSLNLKDPAIQAALNHDYKKFAEGELAIRRKLGLPPFGRLTRLVIQHTKISRVKTVAAELARNLTRIAETVKGVAVIGPNPAVMPRLRNRYRYQILIKCANVSVMRDFLTKIRNDPTAKLMQKEVIIDVDPVDLL